MKIFAVTFNCYKLQFYEKDTFGWLSQQLASSLKGSDGAPDLVAVAFQEFLPFDKAFGGGNDEYEANIKELLLSAIRKGLQDYSFDNLPMPPKSLHRKKVAKSFKFLRMIRHVGNALFIFSRSDLMPVKVSDTRLGLGWLWLGNKGAVAIRLIFKGNGRDGKVLNWAICFLSCHLDSHHIYSQKRNSQFEALSSKIIFNDFDDSTKKYLTLEEQDVIILMGDLNYRVYDFTKSCQELVDFYQNGCLEELLALDQLSKEFSRTGDTFLKRFSEAPITFLPTYKFIPGVGKLDGARVPSWCDRVLISSPYSIYRFIDYFSVPSCRLSDHLPVIAIVELLPRPISHAKRIAEAKLTKKSPPDPFLASKMMIGLAADRLAGLFFCAWRRPYVFPTIAISFLLFIGYNFRNKLF